MQLESVTLDTLGKGGAQEKFDIELAKVLSNIRDPNTEWKKTRRITITVDFVPKENRAEADLVTNVVSKLVDEKPVVSTILFGVKDGQLQAAEMRQGDMFAPPSEGKKVYKLNNVQEGE
ncbi:MAG: hypothetical protein A4E63_00204 [Syntrophorhabdus sp. PtaU1.Bin050]|nr:MAG: hypothetical protein A4E63_00204 [Syntrophorhabdus sp. PtaU1.Bin050]